MRSLTNKNAIRVVLPFHLRTLAHVGTEVEIEVAGPVTLRRVLDELEERYPMLRGTIREHGTLQRRAGLRFFGREEEWSHETADAVWPGVVAAGKEQLTRLGAIAGG